MRRLEAESNTETCSLCGNSFNPSASGEGLKVWMWKIKNNKPIRSEDNHGICSTCFDVGFDGLVSQSFKWDPNKFSNVIDYAKYLCKSNYYYENNMYNAIDDHLESLIEESNINSPRYNSEEDNVYNISDFRLKESRNPRIYNSIETKTKKQQSKQENKALQNFLTPKQIYRELTKTVKGQDKALKDLSVAAFMYLNSLRNPSANSVKIFIMGPTGSGKTQMVDALAEVLGLPKTSFNCGHLTPSGYKGDNVVSIAEKIINLHGEKRAETSILYLDEVDKIMARGDNDSDALKKRVQQDLLKILEGGDLITTANDRSEICLKTKNIFIIATGAFPDFEADWKRKQNKKSVGLNQSQETPEDAPFDFSTVGTGHLINSGFIPEFMGRFSMLTYTNKLNEECSLEILRDGSKSVLNDYTKLFEECKSELVFTNEFLLEHVIRPGLSENTGARGFKKRLDELMADYIFDIEKFVGKRLVLEKDGARTEEIRSTKEYFTA